MNGTRKHLKVFIFLISLHFAASAQTLEDTWKLANHFTLNQEYDAAIELLQRVIYFDTTDIFLKEALLSTANLYFIKGDYRRASNYYGRCYHLFQEDTATSILYQQIRATLADNNYHDAYENLLYLDSTQIHDPEWQSEYQFLKAVTHYGLLEYDTAQAYFLSLAADESEKQAEIQDLFKKLHRKEKKNKTTAYIMSAVVPGLGQFYAGDYKNGLNVFFLSTGFMALTFYSAIVFSPTTALLNVVPWWSRYHIGGMNRAEDSVRNFKQNARHKTYQVLLEITEMK